MKSSGQFFLVVIAILGVFGSCRPRRYSDLPSDEKNFSTPVIYRDTLASDKRKVTVKKPGRRVFYGYKTRKAFTKTVKGRNVTYELFYVLKKPIPLDPYIRDIYWQHRKKRVILMGPIPEKDKPYARILHGPYKKILNRKTIVEGIFYLGAKHGRWEEYAPGDEQLLVEKKKWYKGFPKEAEISFYDVDKTKIKEVRPWDHGVLNGEYFFYSAAGVLLENGKYEYGRRIGIWKEYFEAGRKLKRSLQYAQNGFDKAFVPFVLNEYDITGVMTYDQYSEEKNKRERKAFKAPSAPPPPAVPDFNPPAPDSLKTDSLAGAEPKAKQRTESQTKKADR
jgi:antitoxin component YwqK of YwqJK toxin-antitoxin module